MTPRHRLLALATILACQHPSEHQRRGDHHVRADDHRIQHLGSGPDGRRMYAGQRLSAGR